MNDLSPERWQQIDDLFVEVLDRPPDERTAYLRHVCGDDPALYHEVVALLDHAEAAEQTLGESVTQYAAPLLAHLEADLRANPGEHFPDNGHIGPYCLVREVGRGGMGAVYLAVRADGAFEQTVALKLVKRGMDTDEILRRFRHERQILASLQHPNIAQLHDGGVAPDGRPYLVMEYVEGTPLHRFCDAHTLPVDKRLRLFEAVCEAVHYAHQNLVVHRDLKPSNILVTEQGQVKLLDFGIAKLLSEDAVGLTQTGARLLTPQYASPEQMTGDAVTTATDVYALGVILYELLTGHRPFEHRQATASTPTAAGPERPSTAILHPTERQHADGTTETITPEAASAARATTPPGLQRRLRGDLDTIILKALRPEPERRYVSADAFLDDIKRHLAGLPVAARPASLGYRASKFIQRHRVGVAMAGLMVALLVGFVLVYTVRITQERNMARQERDKAEEVAAFLEALFDASNPLAPNRLDTLQVRDFLHQGAEQARQELDDQPLLQAQMFTVIGRVYGRMGLDDEAVPFLEEALAIRQNLLDPDHPDVAETQTELGDVLFDLGEYAQAESLFHASLRIRRAAYGEHEAVAEALTNHAMALQALGDHDEAESLYRASLAMKRDLLGEQHPEIATTLSTLAWVLSEKSEFEEAEQLYRESLAMRRAVYADGHPRIAIGLNNLATLLRDQQRYDEAESLIREALDINRAALGPRHDHVVSNLNLLASILRGQQRYDDAESVFEEVVALRRETLGPNHPNLSITLDSYAALMKAKGDFARAEELEREAIAIARRVYGDVHYAIALTTGKLASILRESGKAEQALPLYRESVAVYEQVLPADHPYAAVARANLGDCLTELARYQEAEVLLREGYQTLHDTQGADHRLTQHVLKQVIGLYEAWDKQEEAAAYQRLLADASP